MTDDYTPPSHEEFYHRILDAKHVISPYLNRTIVDYSTTFRYRGLCTDIKMSSPIIYSFDNCLLNTRLIIELLCLHQIPILIPLNVQYVNRFPLCLYNLPSLSKMSGAEVYLKLECLQKTGSFKTRGALYAINKLTEEQQANGVVAASAGNHAQGGNQLFTYNFNVRLVAYGASILGIPATIYMPTIAPVAKQRATKAYGAEVVLYGPTLAEALKKAQEISASTNATFIHPYNNENVVCGQATIGLGAKLCS